MNLSFNFISASAGYEKFSKLTDEMVTTCETMIRKRGLNLAEMKRLHEANAKLTFENNMLKRELATLNKTNDDQASKLAQKEAELKTLTDTISLLESLLEYRSNTQPQSTSASIANTIASNASAATAGSSSSSSAAASAAAVAAGSNIIAGTNAASRKKLNSLSSSTAAKKNTASSKVTKPPRKRKS